MQAPKIVAAKALGSTTLIVEFSSYEIKRYDISNLLTKPMFFPLRQSDFLGILVLSRVVMVWFGMMRLILVSTNFGKMEW